MKLLLSMLLALAGLLFGNATCAQSPPLAWSEWETSAVEKRGPERAQAVLLYFHGRGGRDAYKDPILGIFTEMARVADWDTLRINRRSYTDEEPLDDAILRFVADRVTELRREGYKKVIVGGGSGGGWLALLAATVPGVDAAIGLAPGTVLGRLELLRTGGVLARKLAGAKAKRIAVFFFKGDFLEDLEIRRSSIIRPSLEESGATFMIVDHPPDLFGHQAMVTGRLVRRYRDCLLELVHDVDLPVGEVECSPSTGFAVGSDIGFPASLAPLKPPSDVNPAFLPYLGRWEGDDEWGAYLIMEATAVDASSITFAIGRSPAIGASPAIASGTETWVTSVPFQLNASGGAISNSNWGAITARLTAAMGLELEYQVSDENGKEQTYRLLLRKRTDEAAGGQR